MARLGEKIRNLVDKFYRQQEQIGRHPAPREVGKVGVREVIREIPTALKKITDATDLRRLAQLIGKRRKRGGNLVSEAEKTGISAPTAFNLEVMRGIIKGRTKK